jgi:hypothetical protein
MKLYKAAGAFALLLSISICSMNTVLAGEGSWRGVDYGNGDESKKNHDNSPRSHYPIIDYSNDDSYDASADDSSDSAAASETGTNSDEPSVHSWPCRRTCAHTTHNYWSGEHAVHKGWPPEKSKKKRK